MKSIICLCLLIGVAVTLAQSDKIQENSLNGLLLEPSVENPAAMALSANAEPGKLTVQFDLNSTD